MFDLTKEVILEPTWQKRYRYLRGFLYFFFMVSGLYLSYTILFPSRIFFLDLSNPAFRNDNFYYDGRIDDNEIFSAYSREDFSNAKIQLLSNKDLSASQDISIRKTYKAFTYPLAAQPVNSPADDSSMNGTFANGTLLSFDNAVFVVVDGKVMPFNNPLTFLSFGYQWSDVVPATEDKVGLYQRDKLFTINRPHPNGTVFLTRDSQKYFLIQNGQKVSITDEKLLPTYLQRTPIAVDEKSLDFQKACALKRDFWPENSYSCSFPVANFAQTLGNNFQLEISGADKTDLNQIKLTFSRNINWLNLQNTLSDLKQRIQLNYGIATPDQQ